MSKIDEYKKAKELAESMRKFADGAADRENVDKFGVAFPGGLETWIGYCGRSCVAPWPGHIREVVAEEIKLHIRDLVGLAVERLEKEAEQKRNEARAEAQEILENT